MKARDAVNGALAIIDGFGEQPPPQAVADARAQTCIAGNDGKKCPHNYMGGWILPLGIVNVLNKMREVKLQLKLKVAGEEQLGTCEICRCALAFKVHYNFQTIYDHTSDETFGKFPAWCWMKKEYDEHRKQTQTPQVK